MVSSVQIGNGETLFGDYRKKTEHDLDKMKHAGIQSFYVIPFPPLSRINHCKVNMKPHFLTDRYFELIRFVWDGAAKRGTTVWLYDGAAYPSGILTGKI